MPPIAAISVIVKSFIIIISSTILIEVTAPTRVVFFLVKRVPSTVVISSPVWVLIVIS